MKRKLIYGVIYVAVAFTFPSLPLEGIKFLGNAINGVRDGIKEGTIEYAKTEGKSALEDIKDSIFKALNPFD